MRRLIAATAALAIASPALAAEATVSAADPQSVVAALAAKGLSPTLTKDGDGDPRIVGLYHDDKFYIAFYGCAKNQKCATLLFYYGIHMKSPPTIAALNQFNFEHVLLRSYADNEGDPVLKMDVDVDDGGMSPAGFASNLDAWTQSIDDLKKLAGVK